MHGFFKVAKVFARLTKFLKNPSNPLNILFIAKHDEIKQKKKSIFSTAPQHINVYDLEQKLGQKGITEWEISMRFA